MLPLIPLSLLALTGLTTAKTTKVEVGEDGLKFSPSSTMVSAGDKVEFHFYPQNHSVVQGSYDNPCQPANMDAFNSGYVPTMNGESSTTFTITVNDTKPIWYHCGQVSHCTSGMVGVINPPKNGNQTFDAYKKAASNAKPNADPNVVKGGVIGKSKEEGEGEEGMSMSSTSTGGMTMSTSTTSSSASGSTPSSTSAAEKVGISTDLGVMSLLGGVVAMFLI